MDFSINSLRTILSDIDEINMIKFNIRYIL